MKILIRSALLACVHNNDDINDNRDSLLTRITRRAVAEWLARSADGPVKAATMGSIPGRNRVKDRFSVLPSQHLRRPVIACLAFV